MSFTQNFATDVDVSMNLEKSYGSSKKHWSLRIAELGSGARHPTVLCGHIQTGADNGLLETK